MLAAILLPHVSRATRAHTARQLRRADVRIRDYRAGGVYATRNIILLHAFSVELALNASLIE